MEKDVLLYYRYIFFQVYIHRMVSERTDGEWSWPGGWGDIGLTPSEVAIKVVKEESGFDVRAIKLISVLDKKFHPHPPSLYHVYKISM